MLQNQFSFQKVQDVALFPQGTQALNCHFSYDGLYIFVQGDNYKLIIYSLQEQQSKLTIASVGHLSIKETINVIVTCPQNGPIVIHWYSDICWRIIRRQTIAKNYNLQFVSKINNQNIFACNLFIHLGSDDQRNLHIYKLLNKTTFGTYKMQIINGNFDFLFPSFCFQHNILITLVDDQGQQNNSIYVYLFNHYFSEYRFHQQLRKHSFINHLSVHGNKLFAFGRNRKLFIYNIQELGCTNQQKEQTSLNLLNFSQYCIFPDESSMICSIFLGNLSLWSRYEQTWEKDIEIRNREKINGISISNTNKALITSSDGKVSIYQ